ncbi:Hypothetical protein I5071_72090 [Sandaracinus amylolyticus]|nr:Hypothetical protein I5071_72090 [Sandaracinus amylolyticus]
MLEELGVPYEIQHYKRDPKTMLAPVELRRVHPLGKVPVITDDGVTVAESGAILEYLVERYGQERWRPAAGTPDALRFTYWMHYAEGSATPPLLVKLILDRIREAPMPFIAKPIARRIADQVEQAYVEPNVSRMLDFMEGELALRTWFAGDEISAADVQMSFPIEAAAQRFALDRHPKLRAFLQRIHARPAYRRAIERGGPYRYA